MKVLLASTEAFIKREKTVTTADSAAGATITVPVQNTAGFAANDYVVIGQEGTEQAELVQVASVTGESLTLSNLLLAHQNGEPIVKYRYNKRKFYGSLTAGGSYTELTGYGSPVTITVTDPPNTILEYTGTEGYIYFKSTYYNTYDSAETNLVDATEVLADESLRYCSIYAIRRQAGLTDNPYITDGDIEVYRKNAENEVDSWLNSKYLLPYTNASGAQEIPFILENVTKLLAAGYMDYREYGKTGDGVKWLGEARGILKSLQGPGGQTLMGSDHKEMQVVPNSQSIVGYPDDGDTRPPSFTMGQVF